ncbi:MAG: DUF2029 domain-containing protein [Cyanobacteria bacterium REEB67]|nr:DUF2029 domain-containing protein [Cyanobacteria bacterium REEB67]
MKAVRLLLLTVWLAFFAISALASGIYLAGPLKDPLWYLHCAPPADSSRSAQNYQLIDFSQFYQAGQLALSPQAHQVYDPAIQNAWAARLIAPCKPDKIFYNQSVPFLYVLLIPFGKLAYNQAYVLWCLTTMAFALGALAWLVARVGFLRGWALLLFLSGVIACLPFYLTIWHGQTTFLLTGIFALFALFVMQKRNALAGLMLALSTFKPQYMLPFVALAFGLGRGALVLYLLLFESLLMACAAIFIGPENIIGYPHVLAGAESSSNFVGVNPQIMASVRGVLSAFLPHQAAMVVTVTLLLATLVPLTLVARSLLRQTAKSPIYLEACRWLLAFTFVLALIVSPHTHYFDCLLLAVPAALTLPTVDLAALLFKRGPLVEVLSLAHRLWCIVLLLFPLLSWPINFMPASRVVEGELFLAINILLAALAAWQIRHIFSHAQPAISAGDDVWHT